MTIKKLNINRLIIAVFVFIGIALFTTLSIKLYLDFFKVEKITEEKNIDSIELYGYTLKESDTKIYEQYYNELESILDENEINYNKYAEILTKLFIIDFYTLNNKIASTDVGSLEFIHPSQLENFKLNAGDTIYKYVESNIYKERTQELPEVMDVMIDSINDTVYKIDKIEYHAYEIKATWTYVKDLEYETTKTFKIIKDNNILYVVEGA